MALILVADDDASVRRVTRRALERSGHDVVEAVDGDDCLRIARARPPALIVLDIYMPRRDGIETLQALKEELPAVPVLVISGGGERGDSHMALPDALLLGADAILAKPFTVTELQDAVRALGPAP